MEICEKWISFIENYSGLTPIGLSRCAVTNQSLRLAPELTERKGQRDEMMELDSFSKLDALAFTVLVEVV